MYAPKPTFKIGKASQNAARVLSDPSAKIVMQLRGGGRPHVVLEGLVGRVVRKNRDEAGICRPRCIQMSMSRTCSESLRP